MLVCGNAGLFDDALEPYQSALALAKQHGMPRIESEAYSGLGGAYRESGQYDLSPQNYAKALEIAIQLNDLKLQSKAWNGLGRVYRDLSDFDLALDAYQRVIEIAKLLGDLELEATAYSDIGEVHRTLKAFDDSLEAYDIALTLAEQHIANLGGIHDRGCRTIDDFGLPGRILADTGRVLRDQEEYKVALEYYHRALVVADQIGDLNLMARTLTESAKAYQAVRDFSAANKLLDEATVYRTRV